MAKLSTYNNLIEKDEYYSQVKVDTSEQFDILIKEMSKNSKGESYIYRGVCEAKYKLYNSAQREWINKELMKGGQSYSQFVRHEIDNAKEYQDGLLEKFFNAFGQPPYDLSILSFLQHYGAPTPLLDWSYSSLNALYFATENLKHPESDDEIENYFSLYEIKVDLFSRLNLEKLLQSTLARLDDTISQVKSKEDKKNIQSIEDLEELRYNFLSRYPYLYIPGYRRSGFAFSLRTVPSFNLVFNQQNLNVINQKGLFIFNSKEDQPLEVLTPLKKIKCYNIHKSLYNKVLYHLEYFPSGKRRDEHITRAFLYPQEEFIAKRAFASFLEKQL